MRRENGAPAARRSLAAISATLVVAFVFVGLAAAVFVGQGAQLGRNRSHPHGRVARRGGRGIRALGAGRWKGLRRKV